MVANTYPGQSPTGWSPPVSAWLNQAPVDHSGGPALALMRSAAAAQTLRYYERRGLLLSGVGECCQEAMTMARTGSLTCSCA